jgi:hypothetical protein
MRDKMRKSGNPALAPGMWAKKSIDKAAVYEVGPLKWG